MEGEDLKEPGDIGNGQLDEGSETTTDDSTADVEGQSDEPSNQTTDDGSVEDTFFDPREIADKPELMAAYKQMQSAFTKKTQAIKSDRQKIDAYNAFMNDPVGEAQRIMKQYGYDVNKAGQPASNEPWEPSSWDDVMERAKQEVLKDLSPLFSEMKSMKQKSIESQLNEIDPQWKTYEDDMAVILQSHPSLAKEPDKLYKLAVPAEVIEARATKEALKRIERKTQSAKTSGQSTTKAKPIDIGDKPLTFDEAVRFAEQSLSEQGIVKG